ncbi:hypothetical protein MES4922_60146 [Mesorhizobium ventifaucium]|uniref:Uncharacterized protein n=1 Tax=Mesorhizobium ventifaucium TaxID=666020 RepID=A0ABM9ED33_9HYPH|nr:hypothetical protein MES4922_60146 [Mesorhizobium ventifaucium]
MRPPLRQMEVSALREATPSVAFGDIRGGEITLTPQAG